MRIAVVNTMNDWHAKELFVFDLDGTLTLTKSPMSEEMLRLFAVLLSRKKVAVISGGFFPQFHKQFVGLLPSSAKRENLFLFPTTGTRMYRFDDGEWKEVYAESLTREERETISNALAQAVDRFEFLRPSKLYGEQIEDRGTQVTLSVLGQEAPAHLKKAFDPDFSKRLRVKEFLDPLLPDFEVHVAGGTSIDVTKRGIDKAYGIRKMEEHIGVPKEKMLFFGDAMMSGGNDYPVKEVGVLSVEVEDEKDTEKKLHSFLGK